MGDDEEYYGQANEEYYDQANEGYYDQANEEYYVEPDETYYEEDLKQEYCKVYDTEDFFTALVQILLALIALFSLFIKRQNEVPQRDFMTWWLDVSKQGIGAVYVHCLNMITANIISHNVRGENELKDQCAWYAINYFFDTTVGLVLSLVILQLALAQARKYNIESLMHSGVYEGEDGMRHWWNQLLFWITILTLCKIILLGLLWAFSPALAIMGNFLFKPLAGNNQLELVFVMIIMPGILNVFYFWIADEYLKEGEEGEELCTISCCNKDEEADEPKSEYKAPQAVVT